jgi:hypothetical protein
MPTILEPFENWPPGWFVDDDSEDRNLIFFQTLVPAVNDSPDGFVQNSVWMREIRAAITSQEIDNFSSP